MAVTACACGAASRLFLLVTSLLSLAASGLYLSFYSTAGNYNFMRTGMIAFNIALEKDEVVMTHAVSDSLSFTAEPPTSPCKPIKGLACLAKLLEPAMLCHLIDCCRLKIKLDKSGQGMHIASMVISL